MLSSTENTDTKKEANSKEERSMLDDITHLAFRLNGNGHFDHTIGRNDKRKRSDYPSQKLSFPVSFR